MSRGVVPAVRSDRSLQSRRPIPSRRGPSALLASRSSSDRGRQQRRSGANARGRRPGSATRCRRRPRCGGLARSRTGNLFATRHRRLASIPRRRDRGLPRSPVGGIVPDRSACRSRKNETDRVASCCHCDDDLPLDRHDRSRRAQRICASVASRPDNHGARDRESKAKSLQRRLVERRLASIRLPLDAMSASEGQSALYTDTRSDC